MPQVIFKYDLMLTPRAQPFPLGKGARILSTGFQLNPEGQHVLRVWAMVDPYLTEPQDVIFIVIPTGVYLDMPEGFTLLGRADYPGMVVHVFYKVIEL